jgi:hypothetical protein
MHKKQLTKLNLIKIITMTFHVLLKRDMILNRRIYAWFLGTNELCKDVNSQQNQFNDLPDSSSYFIRYTQEILIESLKNSLETISARSMLNVVKSDDDDDAKLMTDMTNTLSSTWTLSKLIRVLLVLGM